MMQTFSHLSGKYRRHLIISLSGSILLVGTIFLISYGFHQNHEKSIRLVAYAFSTQKEVLMEGIVPAFEKAWESETGRDLSIECVFGPSGTLSLQITQGAPADIAIFSNQRHIDWLKFSKVTKKDTNQVVIASTPLVILTRPGNPSGITDFADLMQPGILLIHGDPTSSGVGEWAVLAEYGSAYLDNGDPETAEAQLKDIWKNVRVLGSSARVSLSLFELGAGDALITYEQDAYLARDRNIPLEIIMPQSTILAKHYAVIIDQNVTSVERPVVEAFQAFVMSDEGQKIFSRYYYRPSAMESELLPELVRPFTEDDLGGWAQAYDHIIMDFWKKNIEPELTLVPTAALRVIGE